MLANAEKMFIRYEPNTFEMFEVLGQFMFYKPDNLRGVYPGARPKLQSIEDKIDEDVIKKTKMNRIALDVIAWAGKIASAKTDELLYPIL